MRHVRNAPAERSNCCSYGGFQLRFLHRFPFHTLLFSLYPVAALLAHNIGELRADQAVRSLVVIGAATLGILLLLRLPRTDWTRLSIALTLLLLLFFSYGHVYDALRGSGDLGFALGRHRVLIPVWLALIGLSLWWSLRKVKSPANLAAALNVAALAVLVLPTWQIIQTEMQFAASVRASDLRSVQTCGEVYEVVDPPPDVYYIILDAYTRADFLRSVYQFNNEPFLAELEDLGFTIASASQTNYAFTPLSLGSSLNMEYLETLGVNLNDESEAQAELWALMRHGEVRRIFECAGYRMVSVDSGIYWTSWDDADTHLSPLQGGAAQLRASGSVNAFEGLLIDSSMGLILTDFSTLLPSFASPDVDVPLQEHRERILFAFDSLASSIPGIPGPKFVFVHLLVPHQPFTFGPKGEYYRPEQTFTLAGEEDPQGYRNQIRFTNAQILQALAGILASSEVEPIIILQGDHGRGGGPEGRMAILNAIRLPSEDRELIYPTLSPVNTFRVIFDAYFGTELGLLEDTSYYSARGSRYDFEIVPNAQVE